MLCAAFSQVHQIKLIGVYAHLRECVHFCVHTWKGKESWKRVMQNAVVRQVDGCVHAFLLLVMPASVFEILSKVMFKEIGRVYNEQLDDLLLQRSFLLCPYRHSERTHRLTGGTRFVLSASVMCASTA